MSEENGDPGKSSPTVLDAHPGPRPAKDIAELYLKQVKTKFAALHLLTVAEKGEHIDCQMLRPHDLNEFVLPPREHPHHFRAKETYDKLFRENEILAVKYRKIMFGTTSAASRSCG